VISLPVGERNVVRAAYAWNLAVEIARQGAKVTLLAPSSSDSALLWPPPGRGPVGAEVVLHPAADLVELTDAAVDLAKSRAAEAAEGGVILACAPPAWFAEAPEPVALLRWVLLFTAPDPRELRECYALVKRIVTAHRDARVGITVHGVRRVGDAEAAFSRLADIAARHLSHPLESYGFLVDDLHVYRAIVSRRPIGLEHPQSRAARALRDVAGLVLADAKVHAVG
jgi:MinD-like ATPase involved in chromosome partitioning or flagellar assembly